MFKIETLATRNIWNSSDIQGTNIDIKTIIEPGYNLSFDGTGWSPTNPYQVQNITGSSIIDNSNIVLFSPTTYYSSYILQNPTGEYTNKLLLLGNNNQVEIQSESGTLSLTPDYSSAQLQFNGEKWLRYSTPPNNYQFYPSRLQQQLYGTGYINQPSQGTCVSISGDGNTLVTGAPNDDGNIGACWVFCYTGSTWNQQQKLIGYGYTGMPYQGSSISISSDGNTIALGGQYDNNAVGAVWIFTKNNNTWSQQGDKIVPNDVSETDVFFGYSVSLSSNGDTLIASGPGNNNNGNVWNFQRTSNTWSQVGTGLYPSDATGTGLYFGNCVSVSSNGNVLCAGCPYDNGSIGASWIFTKNNNTWTQQGTKLIPNDGSNYSYFGWYVSISADGNTTAISGPYDNSSDGATWIFKNTGDNWTQIINKLVGVGGAPKGNQGYSISLSPNGNLLIVAQYAEPMQAYVFTCVNGIWKQRPGYLSGPPIYNWISVSTDNSGDRTALSSDGFVDSNNNRIGSVSIFI